MGRVVGGLQRQCFKTQIAGGACWAASTHTFVSAWPAHHNTVCNSSVACSSAQSVTPGTTASPRARAGRRGTHAPPPLGSISPPGQPVKLFPQPVKLFPQPPVGFSRCRITHDLRVPVRSSFSRSCRRRLRTSSRSCSSSRRHAHTLTCGGVLRQRLARSMCLVATLACRLHYSTPHLSLCCPTARVNHPRAGTL